MENSSPHNSNKTKRIGEILVEHGFISPQQLKEALDEQRATGEKLGKILIRKGYVTNNDIHKALGTQAGVSTFDLANYVISPEVVKLISLDIALKYQLMPVFEVNGIITVAMTNPTNLFVIDELTRITGCGIEPVWADELAIRKAQDKYYGSSETVMDIASTIDRDKLSEGEKTGEDAPIVKLVNKVIEEAVQVNASDIHVEPEEQLVNVRYRIDGMLHKHTMIPKDLQSAVLSRFKIMANLDIAEKRVPQDGRIIMRVGNKDIDFRVSTCPTVHGENVVLRILDKSSITLGLEQLGFSPRELEIFSELIEQPYGIVLVTGPTGSGKTTTLYSALKKINREDINIMTVEDPVEYQFPGIRQVHVNVKAGLTFASALRSFLRQDPDVIMVGEIRDLETAEIAVQAALTGHMVFSTLHTNDSPSAFTRLVEMGVEPFLVSSAVLGILAQRLVRRVCPRCKEEYAPTADMLTSLGLKDRIGSDIKFVRGKGCDLCNNSGYKGRVAIYEILRVSPRLESKIIKNVSADEIRETALEEGLKTLRMTAIEKLLDKVTTPEEVLRVTQSSG